MPSTTSLNTTAHSGVFRRVPARRGILYPRLPAILDEDTLSAISTLESEECAYASSQNTGRRQYLQALYVKALTTLGHSHFQPKDLPRQFRHRIAEQLGLAEDLVRITTIDPGEKSRIVSAARGFLGLSATTREDMDHVRTWLQADLAKKESDIAVLVNATIKRFRELRVEIPTCNALQSTAQQALNEATATAFDMINAALAPRDGERIDTLLSGKDGKTIFDLLKKPVFQATPNNLAKELLRIELLRSFLPKERPIAIIARHQMERFAELARRYTAPELAQLHRSRRRTLVLCFLVHRHTFLLDAVADMVIRTWDNTKKGAAEYANTRQQAMVSDYELHQNILSELLSIIQKSQDPEVLWHAVHQYKSHQEYHVLLENLKTTRGWNVCYFDKLEDYYPTLRRFLPDWYRLIPLCSTITDDTIIMAKAFVQKYAIPVNSELPNEGCPTGFLTPPWENKAVKRFSRTGQIVKVYKAPYEIGLLDTTVQGLKKGTVAISDALRYAPMIDHLLPREDFLKRYHEHVEKLGHPMTAQEHYDPLCTRLIDDLRLFDQHYQTSEDIFWVNRNGMLGYSRLPGQTLSSHLKKLKRELAGAMPEVSILDLLLDCHRWTGFMNAFKPASGRQNMSEEERLRHLLVALYAYGCNCGPGQAAKALQIQQNQVIYMRRRYMPTPALMEAATILAQAYQQTPMAERLGEVTVLLTDSMQLRTPKHSLIARQHHRYLSGKSSLLYQHVTSNCICLFTQALLCNVSEAIHMLIGVMQCRPGQNAIINICDSAGKSDLVFGLSSLLNILLYPRVRSRHLKLWGVDENIKYKNIAASIAGQIRLDRIDKGWPDVMWVLASIAAGTAKPDIILNHLASQPHHPATQALEELGKVERSIYLLRYGMDTELRRFVVPHTSRREHWNKFTRDVQAFGDLVREETIEDQEEIFWFLTVVQNAIVLWNSLALENIISKANAEGRMIISAEDTKHILPTMTDGIDFVGTFNLDFQRKPPFDLIRKIK